MLRDANVADSDTVTETQTVSEHENISRNSSKENSGKIIISENETSEKNESVYHVIHTDSDNNGQNNYLIFGGALIIVSLLSVFVYKKGFQHGKETEKKSK